MFSFFKCFGMGIHVKETKEALADDNLSFGVGICVFKKDCVCEGGVGDRKGERE